MTDDDIRLNVLQRLAEQAMSDPDFRTAARGDLDVALAQYGYELNEKEQSLVRRFRDALEEAGVDLFLSQDFEFDLERGLTAESAARLERMLDDTAKSRP